jgi:AraC-like DNA-binding protein
MKHIQTFCDYFYKDSLIPVYLYKGNILIDCYPKQTTLTYPRDNSLRFLLDQNTSLTYITTSFDSFLGCIQLQKDPSLSLVVGPVRNTSYSIEALHSMHREYGIVQQEQNVFDTFYKNIPFLTLNSFLSKLLFINFSLNNISLQITDLLDVKIDENVSDLHNRHIENIYTIKENGNFNNSYEIEKNLIHFIENGNLEGLKNFAPAPIHEGIIAPDALRQVKNTCIVTITLATRAAIRGGLPTETAFQLSDLYIQKLESSTTIESLYKLNAQVVYDFTFRVATSKIPVATNDIFQKAIQFVLQNTNTHLSVSDVAKYVGFSRSYFSHRFKKELGFDLSAFITRCKLEEAKSLLTYTNKNISAISNYLCFSSQSHFQTAFKKQYHVTPLEFRKYPKKSD